MKFTPEQIHANWAEFNSNIENYIEEPRQSQLLEFYKKHEDRIILYPAATSKKYHSAHPGGYVDHVNKVVRCALKQHEIWKSEGVDTSTYTIEELVFSAINHDLGKIGDSNNPAYINQTDKWRRDKLGEEYEFNKCLAFASVPDRGLFLLQESGIKYTFNEMIAIQTHDGLYDEANNKYLKSFAAEQKPRTSLVFILHQADLMASRIEFEMEWGNKFSQNSVEAPKKEFTLTANKKPSNSSASLKTIGSSNLQELLKSI